MQKHAFLSNLKNTFFAILPAMAVAMFFALIGSLALILPKTQTADLWHPINITDWTMTIAFFATSAYTIITWFKPAKRLRFRLLNIWASMMTLIAWISLGLNWPLKVTIKNAELKFHLIYADLIVVIIGLVLVTIFSIVILRTKLKTQPWWLIGLLAIDGLFLPILVRQYNQIAVVENLKTFKWSTFSQMMIHDHMPLEMLNILPQFFVAVSITIVIIIGGVKLYGIVSQTFYHKVDSQTA